MNVTGITTAWLILIIAGIFEVVWAYCMKMSEGFTRLIPSMLTFTFMVLSFVLLSFAMRVLPLGTAYTVWTGIGAIGSLIVGVLILQEPLGVLRMLAAVLIVSGLVLMKIATPT